MSEWVPITQIFPKLCWWNIPWCYGWENPHILDWVVTETARWVYSSMFTSLSHWWLPTMQSSSEAALLLQGFGSCLWVLDVQFCNQRSPGKITSLWRPLPPVGQLNPFQVFDFFSGGHWTDEEDIIISSCNNTSCSTSQTSGFRWLPYVQ
jgi:hypothetical protein